MGYIYMIRNKLNDKKYIGKTLDTIESRWKEHCHDYKKARCEKRPLYNAMNKYGLDAFEIIEIEEVDNSIINEREEYWIAYYNTYLGEGYNGTKGGDGKQLYDYQEIANKYLELNSNVNQTLKYFGCDRKTVLKAIKTCGIPFVNHQNDNHKAVICLDKTTLQEIKSFENLRKAAEWIKEQKQSDVVVHNIATSIGKAVSGKMKTAYGYIWKEINRG